MRFKSHSAKEAFYKGRKSLGPSRQTIKIRPSLSSAQRDLLNQANQHLEKENDVDLENPPEFVFADVHGNIQVKMKKRTEKGMFFTINSIAHLMEVIGNANMCGDAFDEYNKINSWADV